MKTMLGMNGSRALLFAGLLALHTAFAPGVHAQTQMNTVRFKNITGDADSEISLYKKYTHLVDFGSNRDSPTPVVNGVRFHSHTVGETYNSTEWKMPNAPQYGWDAKYGWRGAPQQAHDGGSTGFIVSPPGSGMHSLFWDMHYQTNNGELQLTGLTPGVEYDFRFYQRQWSQNNRTYDYAFRPGNVPEVVQRYNPDGQKADVYLAFRYTADSTGVFKMGFTMVPGAEGTLHMYGFSNEEAHSCFLLTPANITMFSADLGVLLVSDDLTVKSMTLHWGAEDGVWDDSVTIAAPGSDGVWSATATPLDATTQYAYRIEVLASDNKTYMSALGTFTTRSGLPDVAMRSATAQNFFNASAEVELTWLGGTTTGILLAYGPVKGGDTIADWTSKNPGFAPVVTNACALGVHTLAMSGLSPNTTYHCRAFAFNAAGTNAAPTILSFDTPNHATWTAGGGVDTHWDQPANWDNGLPTFPGAIANFYHANALVTATNNLTVAAALFNAAGKVVLDLGANKLSAPRVAIGGGITRGGNPVAGYPANGGATVVLSSGTLEENAVINGGNPTFSVGDLAGRGNNTLIITNTGVLKAGVLTVGGPSNGNTLRVYGDNPGGATRLTVHQLWIGGNDNITNVGSNNSGIFERATLTSAFRIVVNAMNDNTVARNKLLLLDSSTATCTSFVMQGDNTAWFDVLVISNSTVTVTGGPILQGGGNTFRIFQDAGRVSRLYATDSIILRMQRSAYNRIVNHGGTLETAETISFQDGNFSVISTNGLVRAKNCEFYSGNNVSNHRLELIGPDALLVVRENCVFHPTRNIDNNGIYINNGLASITNQFYIAGAPTAPERASQLRIAGNTGRLRAGSFVAGSGSRLVFDIPDNGFDETPVRANTTATFDPAVKFVINVDAFTGAQELVRANSGVSGAIPEENFTFNLPRNHVGKVLPIPNTITIKISPVPTLFMVR